jgi:hypothetical protein
MEILLEITGLVHYVALAVLAIFAGGVAISTVNELWQRSWREESLVGSA